MYIVFIVDVIMEEANSHVLWNALINKTIGDIGHE